MAEDLQQSFEARLDEVIKQVGGRSPERSWALVRALIHKAVHLGAETKEVEFCAVATYLAESIGHAHGLMHPQSQPDAHDRPVH